VYQSDLNQWSWGPTIGISSRCVPLVASRTRRSSRGSGPGLPGLLAGEARQTCNDFTISLASVLQNLSFFRVPDVADPS